MSLTSDFSRRHIGPDSKQIQEMLSALGFASLDDLAKHAIPSGIRTQTELKLPKGLSEIELINDLKNLAKQNKIFKSYIGQGYYNCVTPGVILRNILENPGWYTQYTPYQAEISQGRLEALLNFQTMVCDLTGMEIANASLLDEGTAAAEAMAMALHAKNPKGKCKFLVSSTCFTQTIEVIRTRAEPLNVEIVVSDPEEFKLDSDVLGVLVQYPNRLGEISDYRDLAQKVKAAKAMLVVAADILSLALLKPPGEWGADVVVGSTQRFGVPMGYGGPHAAYFATKNEFKRLMPGRLVGVSVDKFGNKALRLALQTREQHIRRNKATSNICTAQVLLAVMASMYAVYHGPHGIREIAERVRTCAQTFAEGLIRLGVKVLNQTVFDTVTFEVEPSTLTSVKNLFRESGINAHFVDNKISVSFDETTSLKDVQMLWAVVKGKSDFTPEQVAQGIKSIPANLARKSEYLTHPIFNQYHSETEMLRYITRLQNKDLSLTTSMIPLGSCTMKLNATAEMIPVTWPEFSNLHPFAPLEQTAGYQELFKRLESQLSEITGFDGISLQPNAGSQGEYAGLLVIRAYQKAIGQGHRNICLIPTSAHGTNPASAVMAGLEVVPVLCDNEGNISIQDLSEKVKQHAANLSALMVTYPSTHGVFEEGIRELCDIVHQAGGQVYMDGANMNAQVGVCRPGEYGPDVCHLNLHKTFCIPHGGGGPGVGPIGVRKHLVPFLPGHPVVKTGGEKAIGPISAAPWGSASILSISYSYIRMMGAEGLKRATLVSILNANYIAKRLSGSYDVLYKGKEGLVAHECILDLRPFKEKAGVDFEDVAKRLMDFGFHAPTMSWPVGGTMMIEPTESESKVELDRFCDALISIRKEIDEIAAGKVSRENNVLKNAPHTAMHVTQDSWDHPYSRSQAAFPDKYTKLNKFWPSVSRIDNPYGDRNLVCTCPSMEEYANSK